MTASAVHRARVLARRAAVAGAFALSVPAAADVEPTAPAAVPTRSPQPQRLVPVVVESYPHDRRAFTQGLLLDGDSLYESTGLNGRSSLREVDLATGTVERRHDLPRHLFGEGLAKVEDRLIQLTWTNGIARVYTAGDFTLVDEHRYRGQGWGLCFDGELLVMSDGSHRISLRDPTTFEQVRVIEVHDGAEPVSRLNELECVGKRVYANLWGSWRIVRFDRDSGRVDAEIDASGIMPAAEKAALPPEAVLNGIAHDAENDTFLLTGKLWPKVYRVRLRPAGGPPATTAD